jgi:hypothetical protein
VSHRSSIPIVLVSLLALALAGCTREQEVVHGGSAQGDADVETARGEEHRPTCEDATDHAIVLALREARTPEERTELERKTARGRARLVETCSSSKDPDRTIACILASTDKERMEECYFAPRGSR